MTSPTPYKYFAFISYNSHDTAWGKRLQRKLESYRMPTTVCNEHGWKRTPIKPVFFAPTDIQPGGLTAELQERLKASQNLIVICSPHSARSKWVGQEITFFHSLGRTEHIHFFIVDGIPHSGHEDTECFNPVVNQLGLPEILGANVHEKIYRWGWLNRERAFVQLITKLLGMEFDAIWQRHKRRMVQRITAWCLGTLLVLAALVGVWAMNKPIDITVGLHEASTHNPQLPPLKKAILTLKLDGETKTDTLDNIADKGLILHVPSHYIGQEIPITFTCKDFLPIDTVMVLSGEMTLDIRRDSRVYGQVHFRLWNPDKEQAVSNCRVTVNGRETRSDENGYIDLFLPLEEQRTAYPVTSDIPLLEDSVYMPSGEDDVILTE